MRNRRRDAGATKSLRPARRFVNSLPLNRIVLRVAGLSTCLCESPSPQAGDSASAKRTSLSRNFGIDTSRTAMGYSGQFEVFHEN
jgi:hypothetical protein